MGSSSSCAVSGTSVTASSSRTCFARAHSTRLMPGSGSTSSEEPVRVDVGSACACSIVMGVLHACGHNAAHAREWARTFQPVSPISGGSGVEGARPSRAGRMPILASQTGHRTAISPRQGGRQPAAASCAHPSHMLQRGLADSCIGVQFAPCVPCCPCRTALSAF